MTCTELLELAAAQSIGALDPADVARLESRLAIDPGARLELAALRDTVAALSVATTPAASPTPAVRARILQAVSGRTATIPASTSLGGAGFHFVLNDETGWIATPIHGYRKKLLSVSRDAGYQVSLGRLEPGTVLPEHDHEGSEQVFIISGHLHTEGRVLGPGDFLHSEPGTRHHELVSPDGCVALLIQKAATPSVVPAPQTGGKR